MTITIEESGLTFGPFARDDCFELEKSEAYLRINRRSKSSTGIKVCEFALIHRAENRAPAIWLVEAKSSSPRPDNPEKLADFISDIQHKLSNALQLLVASYLDRHPEAATELPAGFRALSLREEWRLVLVINGHQEAWLPPLQDALQGALHTLTRTFELGPRSVVVINETAARRYGLTT